MTTIYCVAPLVGAWIEITVPSFPLLFDQVAPPASICLEICNGIQKTYDMLLDIEAKEIDVKLAM